jgi:membrane-associated phospholipid phosphatase
VRAPRAADRGVVVPGQLIRRAPAGLALLRRAGAQGETDLLQDSSLKWGVIGAVALVDGSWIAATDFRFAATSALPVLLAIAALATVGWFYGVVRHDRTLFLLCDAAAQLIAGFAVAATLSYLTLGTGSRLIDAELAATDRALGFDWPATVQWIQAHPWLDRALALVYHGSVVQMLVLALAPSPGQESRVRELVGATLISLVLTIILSGPFPAAGAYPYFGAAHPELIRELQLQHFFPLREGTLRLIDLRQVEGLISFPSFHTALSIIFVYVARRGRLLLAVSALVNAAVLVSTLTAGGHYLSDILAGALVTLLSIALYRRVTRRSRPVPGPAIAEDSASAWIGI